jgi:hypothetical protein
MEYINIKQVTRKKNTDQEAQNVIPLECHEQKLIIANNFINLKLFFQI